MNSCVCILVAVVFVAMCRPCTGHAAGLFNSKWIQGSAFHAENPDKFTVKVHATGITVTPKNSLDAGSCEWFHVPLSVLARREGMIAFIENVQLAYTVDGAEINAVHVYDGDKKIASHDRLSSQGEPRLHNVSEWSVNRNIDKSLSISVCIKFNGATEASTVTLIGAGTSYRYKDNMHVVKVSPA